MTRARAGKALLAVLATLLLAAPAPAVTAAADSVGRAPAARTPAPAPAPTTPPVPRQPGGRGLEVGVPAYVWADDPMLNDVTATGPAASLVVLNPGNGDSPFDNPWRDRADALRGGTTSTGERTRVLGYVHTDHGNRDIAAVKASVDNYLKTPDGRLHVDGIFFDVVSRDCGPDNATRDHYAELRRYVRETMDAVDPTAPDLVVNNPGTAIADCYLEPGRRTADVFVTYEDTYAAYTSGGGSAGTSSTRRPDTAPATNSTRAAPRSGTSSTTCPTPPPCAPHCAPPSNAAPATPTPPTRSCPTRGTPDRHGSTEARPRTPPPWADPARQVEPTGRGSAAVVLRAAREAPQQMRDAQYEHHAGQDPARDGQEAVRGGGEVEDRRGREHRGEDEAGREARADEGVADLDGDRVPIGLCASLHAGSVQCPTDRHKGFFEPLFGTNTPPPATRHSHPSPRRPPPPLAWPAAPPVIRPPRPGDPPRTPSGHRAGERAGRP